MSLPATATGASQAPAWIRPAPARIAVITNPLVSRPPTSTAAFVTAAHTGRASLAVEAAVRAEALQAGRRSGAAARARRLIASARPSAGRVPSARGAGGAD